MCHQDSVHGRSVVRIRCPWRWCACSECERDVEMTIAVQASLFQTCSLGWVSPPSAHTAPSTFLSLHHCNYTINWLIAWHLSYLLNRKLPGSRRCVCYLLSILELCLEPTILQGLTTYWLKRKINENLRRVVIVPGEFSYELERSGTKNIQVVYAWMAAYVSKYEPTVFLLFYYPFSFGTSMPFCSHSLRKWVLRTESREKKVGFFLACELYKPKMV